MRKTWGQAVASVWATCEQPTGLFTQNVFGFLTRVGNSRGYTRGYQQVFLSVFHGLFRQFTAVIFQVLPTIPSAYNKNNKVYLINSYIYIGAAS